jgi:signal transduction histidine kinase
MSPGGEVRPQARRSTQHSIYRAGAMLRAALLLLALLTNLTRDHQAARPAVLMMVTAGMAIWTVLISVLNQLPKCRNILWMGLDLLVTVAIVASSRWILGEPLLRESYLNVAGYWMVAAPLATAIWKGALPGGLAGLVVGVISWAQAPTLYDRAWVDFVCVVAVPAFAGYVARELEELESQRDQSYAQNAALTERERLNRIVHDGVLQVLAMVEREGRDLGPRGQRLARLASDQENSLRALLQDKTVAVDDGSTTDLIGMLTRHQNADVTFSTMAGRLMLPVPRANEIDAALTQVLANTAEHGGPGAHSWILVEVEDKQLIISIRDNGVGMTEERVAQAASQGSMGISESIQGRISALGGTAKWRSMPGRGVEWEFSIPLDEQ